MSLRAHTPVDQTRKGHIFVSPEHEMMQKSVISLLPIVLPALKLSWAAVRGLLKHGSCGKQLQTTTTEAKPDQFSGVN